MIALFRQNIFLCRALSLRAVLALVAMIALFEGSGVMVAPSASAGPAAMGHEQLRRMFPGRFVARVRNYEVTLIASAGGRLTGHFGPITDKGRWSLRGRRLCIRFNEWLEGRTRCATVRRAGGSWLRAGSIRFRRL